MLKERCTAVVEGTNPEANGPIPAEMRVRCEDIGDQCAFWFYLFKRYTENRHVIDGQQAPDCTQLAADQNASQVQP